MVIISVNVKTYPFMIKISDTHTLKVNIKLCPRSHKKRLLSSKRRVNVVVAINGLCDIVVRSFESDGPKISSCGL